MFSNLPYIVKMIPAIIAAILLGRWFQKEQRKVVAQKKEWYQVYLTIPGIIIILFAFGLPIAIWIIKHCY